MRKITQQVIRTWKQYRVAKEQFILSQSFTTHSIECAYAKHTLTVAAKRLQRALTIAAQISEKITLH